MIDQYFSGTAIPTNIDCIPPVERDELPAQSYGILERTLPGPSMPPEWQDDMQFSATAYAWLRPEAMLPRERPEPESTFDDAVPLHVVIWLQVESQPIRMVEVASEAAELMQLDGAAFCEGEKTAEQIVRMQPRPQDCGTVVSCPADPFEMRARYQ